VVQELLATRREIRVPEERHRWPKLPALTTVVTTP